MSALEKEGRARSRFKLVGGELVGVIVTALLSTRASYANAREGLHAHRHRSGCLQLSVRGTRTLCNYKKAKAVAASSRDGRKYKK